MEFSPSISYRFKKDLNLPLPIYFKEHYFNYYLDIMSKHLYPEVKQQWDIMKSMIEGYGNADCMLERYAMIKDAVINYIKSSEKYAEFNQCKLPTVKNDIPSTGIYNEDNIGKRFVSIDLRHANFQTLRKYGVIPNIQWFEFIDGVAKKSGFTKDDKALIKYVANSKYTRQVIFGQCNPKRTIALEKVYIDQVRELADAILTNYKLASVNSDELIYEIPNISENKEVVTFDDDLAKHIQEQVMEKLDLDVRLEQISFVGIKLKNDNDYTVASGYFNIIEGHNYFKCVPEPYMPMFIEWYNACQDAGPTLLNGYDNFSLYSQYIVHDGVICKFDEKLHIEVVDKN